jgi:aspartate 1-decarboxylase
MMGKKPARDPGSRATKDPLPMRRSMLKSKLHRVTVTEANLDYEGSLTIDVALLEAADILPFEKIHVWNVTSGSRLRTYAMIGERDSGMICVNGAAARLVQPGDRIIIATFAWLEESEIHRHRPRVVLVNERNRVRTPDAEEIPGPRRRQGIADSNPI